MTRKLLTLSALAVLTLWVPDISAAQRGSAARKKGSADRVKQAEPQFDVAAVNDPNLRELVGPGSAGSATVRAQILLDRAHFSPGEIDGRFGENTRIAIQGYQASRKLPINGTVDLATWDSLNGDTAPALVPYTMGADDVAGPFEKIPSDMMEKSKLKTLGYSSPQEALGERFHIDPALLAYVNPGRDLGREGEQIMAPNVVRQYGRVQADRVIVSKTRKIVEALGPTGAVLAQYPATIGSEHDPLPLGNWKVTVVQQNPVFNYNPDLFWDADPSHSKAKIAPGPNNPVGVVWIGLSKEHYGIHGTPEPGTIGHTQSHGCIRLTNWDASELSQMVNAGTPVILQEP